MRAMAFLMQGFWFELLQVKDRRYRRVWRQLYVVLLYAGGVWMNVCIWRRRRRRKKKDKKEQKSARRTRTNKVMRKGRVEKQCDHGKKKKVPQGGSSPFLNTRSPFHTSPSLLLLMTAGWVKAISNAMTTINKTIKQRSTIPGPSLLLYLFYPLPVNNNHNNNTTHQHLVGRVLLLPSHSLRRSFLKTHSVMPLLLTNSGLQKRKKKDIIFVDRPPSVRPSIHSFSSARLSGQYFTPILLTHPQQH